MVASPTYSSERKTLKKKIVNILIKYIGINIETDSEIILLRKAAKRYKFVVNSNDEVLEVE